MPGSHILSFGSYRLDTLQEQLRCDTQPVRLTPKAFQVLSYVVERPGQLVTKEELFRVLWADTVVGDAALTTCIQEIRKALQDDAKSPQYLETVHRRGFRFIAPVAAPAAPVPSTEFRVPSRDEIPGSQDSVDSRQQEESQKPVLSLSTLLRINSVEGENGENTEQAEGLRLEASEPPPSSPSSLQPVASSLSQDSAPTPQHSPTSRFSRGLILAAVLLIIVTAVTVHYLSLPVPSTQPLIPNPQSLPLPDKPSIIVLPLVNLSNDPEQDYFSDGLTEVLTGDLSRISSLLVIARNSAFTYKGKAVKVQDVSKEMGVKYVLEGSVQKAEQRVRINVQLIDATTGYHVWSQQYDRPLQDIFALQDEIVQKIVTTLKLQLTLQEQGILVRKHTNNVEAYDAFLRGVEHYHRFTQEANAQARQLYEKAVALDPQYAEAYAQLGLTYYMAWSLRWSADPQTLERAVALEQQALVLNDLLPSAHAILGMVYARQQQYDQAIAEGERALALDPNNAGAYIGQAHLLSLTGRPEEALRALERAMRLNPRYPPNYLYELGWAYRASGRYTEAIPTLQDFLSRKPDAMAAHLDLAVSYLFQWVSQQSPAGQTLEPAIAAGQRALSFNDSWHLNHIVLGSIYLYQRQYEQAVAKMEQAVTVAPTEAGSYAALAQVLSQVGRTEEALEAAAEALRLKSSGVADEHLGSVGVAYAIAGRYEEARAPLQRYLSRFRNMLPAHLTLAVVYSELGQAAEARAEAVEVLRLNPNFSLELHKQRTPTKDPAVVEQHSAALRKAGLK